MLTILQPKGWAKPIGYANGISGRGRQVFVSGQIGWNANCVFESDDLAEQTRQALKNVIVVLAEAGAEPKHVASMTWYLIDKADYLRSAKAIGQAWREVMVVTFPLWPSSRSQPWSRIERRSRFKRMPLFLSEHSNSRKPDEPRPILSLSVSGSPA
jgi:enamine deaminase RidA (YjgF/YER057c/UK114 family)